jgi:hypothetical protein
MKLLTLPLLVSIICLLFQERVAAQTTDTEPPARNIHLRFIGKDSINLPLNENFEIIEDSCSTIIRLIHLNIQDKRLFGNLRDVSRHNPNLVVTEGYYSTTGLKEGNFIAHYLNGNIQAKGNFKNDKFDGKWEFFYDDATPKITFEANGSDIKIIDAWDLKGNKIVNDGNGNYRADLGALSWIGKLINGKPEGSWKCVRADDGNNVALSTENYKNGQFIKGNSPRGSYTDAARVILITSDMLPFTRGELLQLSVSACDVVSPVGNVINAHYKYGGQIYDSMILDGVHEYMRTTLNNLYLWHITLNAEITEDGRISNVVSAKNDSNFSDPLISMIKRLPKLEPATIDGKPIKQKFTISFNFDQYFTFAYRFLPLDK